MLKRRLIMLLINILQQFKNNIEVK